MTTILELDIVKKIKERSKNDKKRKRSQMDYVWYRS